MPFTSTIDSLLHVKHLTNPRCRIGCFFGAVSVFICGERLGRKRCIYVGAFLQGLGAILQASSFGVPQIIVGRIVW